MTPTIITTITTQTIITLLHQYLYYTNLILPMLVYYILSSTAILLVLFLISSDTTATKLKYIIMSNIFIIMLFIGATIYKMEKIKLNIIQQQPTTQQCTYIKSLLIIENKSFLKDLYLSKCNK